jgi:hypothetical protein
MFIRRCCRLKAAKGQRGQALVIALMVLLLAIPAGITFYRFVSQALRGAMHERQQKTAVQAANSAFTDYMRQFSQDAYSGHYDAASLSRPESFFGKTGSSVTFIADEVNRTVYLRAEGLYGSPGSIQARRTLEALIQFQSDLTQYGTMINGPFTIGASNVTYGGGLWFNGNLTVSGANVRFSGGPMVVNGNVTAPASAVLDGDLYYSGASAGSLTVLGTRYNFVPSTTWPTLDFSYYDAHYTYKTSANQTVVFNSTGTFTVVGGGTFAIPANGALIYGENCNLTLRGVVSGRVTVVAGGPVGSATQGNIVISDNLYYAGASSVTASALYAFAALARNRITFSKAAGDLLVVGIYFVEQGTGNMTLTGASGANFSLYGVRTQGISLSPGTSFGGGRSLVYDANLRSFPPPALPERALLVNWKL